MRMLVLLLVGLFCLQAWPTLRPLLIMDMNSPGGGRHRRDIQSEWNDGGAPDAPFGTRV
jgi:hypothetical protein